MPPDDRQQDASTPVNVPNELLNNNNGSGTFNQVNGVQNIYHCSHYGDYPSTCNPESGVIEEGANSEGLHDGASMDKGLTYGRELEPYRTAIDVLCLIRQHMRSFSECFTSDATISGICNEVDELVALLRCVARIIRQVRQSPSVLTSRSIFSLIEHRAFEWTPCLRELENDLYELKPRQDSPRTAETTACLWASLFQRLQKIFCACRAGMTQFLRIIVASRLLEIFNFEGLAELITRSVPTFDLHHPTVDAIWVREPTGLKWYSIPLEFCETWKI